MAVFNTCPFCYVNTQLYTSDVFTSDFTRMISIMRDRVVSDTQTPVGDKATVCIFGSYNTA